MALFRKAFMCHKNIFNVKSVSHSHNRYWSTQSSLALYKDKSSIFLKSKFNEALSWYQEFTGLGKLYETQAQAVVATEMLKEAQDRRREAKSPLADIQKKIQEFQPELRNLSRDDDRYLELIRQEHMLLKEMRLYQQQLQGAEAEEREAFERLSTALRTSHEAERLQAEKSKYISIISYVVGAIIGVVGSSINNHYRIKKIEQLVLFSANAEKSIEFQNIIDSVNNLSKQLQKDNTIVEVKKNEFLIDKEEKILIAVMFIAAWFLIKFTS